MKNKTKGIIIDFIILSSYSFILMNVIYFFNLSRLVAALLIVISIPITWTTLILSILGKNTIGQIIVNRKDKTK